MPIWVAIRCLTSLASINLADADAGTGGVIGDHRQILAALTDQFGDDLMREPTPIKPPISSDAPSGIISTALDTLIALLICAPWWRDSDR